MVSASSMSYIWLYLSHSDQALPQLMHALSIAPSNLIDGDDAQAVAGDIEHLNESGLQYFALSGDFSLSCDIRLTGWTRARILDQLLMLSNHGLRIAMLDESSDNPFDALLFEAGSTRRVTVVQNDTSNEVGLYPHGSHPAT
jgi:hypothetical protein